MIFTKPKKCETDGKCYRYKVEPEGEERKLVTLQVAPDYCESWVDVKSVVMSNAFAEEYIR